MRFCLSDLRVQWRLFLARLLADAIDEDKINAWTMAESKKLWSTLNDRTY